MTLAGRGSWLATSAAWASALACLVGGVAIAQGPPRVRVEGSNADPVTRGLISELRSSGFVVIATPLVAPGELRVASGEQLGAILRAVPGAGVRR